MEHNHHPHFFIIELGGLHSSPRPLLAISHPSTRFDTDYSCLVFKTWIGDGGEHGQSSAASRYPRSHCPGEMTMIFSLERVGLFENQKVMA